MWILTLLRLRIGVLLKKTQNELSHAAKKAKTFLKKYKIKSEDNKGIIYGMENNQRFPGDASFAARSFVKK